MARRKRVEGDANHNIYSPAGRPEPPFELGYRDSNLTQRWKRLGDDVVGIKQARAQRDMLLGRRGMGERVVPSPRLRFGDAADAWLAGPVADLRPTTRAAYTYALAHALKRWRHRRLDSIGPNTCVQLVRDLRVEGLADSYIGAVLSAAHQTFRFARHHLHWQRSSPVADLLKSERPKAGSGERRVYEGDELAQTIAAASEPWATLFRLAAVVGARESELLGLWWEDLKLDDLDAAVVTFTHQVDRGGVRVPLKTDESKATLPLPRATALMLLEHKARSRTKGPRAFVFATSSGRPLGQRNVLRALYTAQERARDEDGLPTFPDLFEHDERGNLAVDDQGRYVPRRVRVWNTNGKKVWRPLPRRELRPLPDFHAIRHAAAMDCDDAEEARDLLRHRNSNVTRAVYRAHFGDRRREALRARMEARMEAAGGDRRQQTPEAAAAEIVDLREVRDSAQ
jgi:integrase